MKVANFKVVVYLAIFVFSCDFPGAWSNYSDPCKSNPCGEGAECQRRSNLAICVCPGDTSGDPFVSCKSASSSSTRNALPSTTSYTSSSTSSMSPQHTSSMTTSDVRSTTYSTYPSETTTHGQVSTRFSNFDRYGTATRPSSTTPYYNTHSTTSYSPSPATETNVYRKTYDSTDSVSHATRDSQIRFDDRGSQNRYDSGGNQNRHVDRGSPIRYDDGPIRGDDYRSNPGSTTYTTTTYRDENGNSNNRRYEDHPHSHTTAYNGNRREDNSGSMNSRDNYGDSINHRGDHHENPNRRGDYGSDANRRHEYSPSNRNDYNDPFTTRKVIYEDQFSSRRDDFDHSNRGDTSNKHEDRRNDYGSQLSSNDRYNTESSSSYSRDRYPGGPSSSSITFQRTSSSGSKVRDPLGVYKNCIERNNVVICADESESSISTNQGSARRSDYESTSRQSISSNQANNNYRDSYQMSSRPTGSSSYKALEDNSHFSRRTGPASNVYQELVVSTSNDKPEKKHSIPRDEHTHSTTKNDNLTPQPGDSEQCKKFCGINSVCRSLLGRPICGCPEGYTGDASVQCVPEQDQLRMKNRCQKHTECLESQICEDSQCIDPCVNGNNDSGHSRMKRMNHFDEVRSRRRNDHHHDSLPSSSRGESRIGMCGSNTQCQVIGHTPLCRCKDGYTGNPYSGCIPSKK